MEAIMDLYETLKIFQTEMECIKRHDSPKCKRECNKCDCCVSLPMMIEAYGNVITVIQQILADRPILVYKGLAINLTQEHIDVLAQYERDALCKEAIERFKESFEEDLKKSVLDRDQMRIQLGLQPLENGVVRLEDDHND